MGIFLKLVAVGGPFEFDDPAGLGQSIDDSISNDGILKELFPSEWVGLRGHDDRAFLISLLDDIKEVSCFLVGVRPQSKVIKYECWNSFEPLEEVQISSCGLLRMNLFEQKVDGMKLYA